MTAKKKSSISQEILEAYDRMISGLEGIERKGAAMPYTSVNGHMFSFLNPEGKLCLRLPKESREAFIHKHQTKLAEQHGAILNEYVEVPEDVFHNEHAMRNYFSKSFDFVQGLKPKATSKKS